MSGHTADYDVIIAGAGPAGSVTAAQVASAGYRVLVLEKNASCMSPCAGYVSRTVNMELPEDCVLQSKITRMRTYFPDMSFSEFQLNGFVVDRPSFDSALAVKAKEKGAELMWNSPVTGISDRVRFRGGSASGKIIVGADGVFSRTASFLGIERQKIAVCAQYHIKGIKTLQGTCEVFFDHNHAPGGYAWIYPAGEDCAKVGLGIAGSGSPRTHLDSFLHAMYARFGEGKKTGYVTGALPVSGLREKLVYDNVLLVGDSAGMADPITGAGINNAMLAGEIAGRTIIEALENDDVAVLSRYEIRIAKLLGRTMKRALEKRKKLNACSNNELLQKHLPGLWVTFKQYWE